jgi:cell division septation protein DedD
MDKIMSLAERQKGVAMAIDMAKMPAAPAAKTAQAKPAEKKPPEKKPAVQAATSPKAQVAARGAWRIQLGAFSTRGAAEGLYKKLAGSAALAGRQAYYVPVGKITRLQAGPFETRASAASACARLAPQPCFTVEAR